jgi:ribose transport system ATP-binding protein
MSDVVLEARNVRLQPDSAPVSVAFQAAEIVGIAGLDGHGQEEFLEMLCGLRRPVSGEVLVHEKQRVQRVQNVHQAFRSGIVYLPRNRKTQGILPALSVLDNFAIATLGDLSWMGILRRRRQRDRLQVYRDKLSMVYASPRSPISSLSGGNQQKVLLARWMAANPRIMLLNDPTRGVDLRTRLTLYGVFRDMAAREGTTLVLLSTEIEEVLELCGRVLIFRDQHLFAELSQERMTMSNVIESMFGGRQHEAD